VPAGFNSKLLFVHTGSLPHYLSDPLLFPQSNFHSQWLVLRATPHVSIWDNIRPEDLNVFLSHLFLHVCRSYVFPFWNLLYLTTV
jgi:hypothetical protein